MTRGRLFHSVATVNYYVWLFVRLWSFVSWSIYILF